MRDLVQSRGHSREPLVFLLIDADRQPVPASILQADWVSQPTSFRTHSRVSSSAKFFGWWLLHSYIQIFNGSAIQESPRFSVTFSM
ncbi:hypothetical protein K443DRAFT_678537 [Laccaria amethystina LaAM-08-1]|uniref:Uncharacterized protein n=1 Tax=Laccaria amethystina LaAM-08-1 TaxID=1095629 RepID=A0A0C9WRL6_9AGAR|nr:hypothetical protein K443DRAFT_678537 [Laccaria amethystina LaAM-08-1]